MIESELWRVDGAGLLRLWYYLRNKGEWGQRDIVLAHAVFDELYGRGLL